MCQPCFCFKAQSTDKTRLTRDTTHRYKSAVSLFTSQSQSVSLKRGVLRSTIWDNAGHSSKQMARPSHLYMRSLSGRCIVVAVVFVGPITPTSTTPCIHAHVSIIYLISSPEANLPLSSVHACIAMFPRRICGRVLRYDCRYRCV